MEKNKQILSFLLNKDIKFGTVSGVFTTKPNLIKWVDINIPEINIITTKSYQVNPNPGNKEPIIAEIAVGSYGNAVGLRNPGMEKAFEQLTKLRQEHNFKAYLNISLSASSIEDFITLVKKFEKIADILELNFSCPHAAAGFGASIGSDSKIVYEYIKEIRKHTNALLFPKLTPNVENIGEIAKAAIDAGADGIVAINTVGPELYLEPHTQKPLLYNPKGHKGGKSGKWVKEIALKKIKEIHDAIGDDYPIIGMGGIETAKDVMNMKNAGANVICLGSVFARVPMHLRPKYVCELKKDLEKQTNKAEEFLIKKRLAEYKPFKIKKIIDKTETLRIIELDGTLDYEASQFAFLWIPNVGEKPFSIAKSNPLTFIIRKREYDSEKKKGLVTHALFQLKENEHLMLRSSYGQEPTITEKPNAYIISGGTGIAVAPKLAETLHKKGKNVVVYYGIRDENQIVFEGEIKKYAKYFCVCDNGTTARVLNIMQDDLKNKNINEISFYNVGPVPLMKSAMEIQEKLGANSNEIFSSIETNNMCGIGICGECECGGKLTCQEGTFFSLEFLRNNKINLDD